MYWLLVLSALVLIALICIGVLNRGRAKSKDSSARIRARYATIDATRMMPPNAPEQAMMLARSYVARHNRLITEIGSQPPSSEVVEAIRVLRRKLATLSQMSTDSDESLAVVSPSDASASPSFSSQVEPQPAVVPVPTSTLLAPVVDTGDTQGKDAWEPWDFDRTTMMRVTATVRFEYVDRQQRETNRRVDVQSIAVNGDDDHIVVGYCWLRFARRTFRASAISNCVDEATGEVIPDIVEFLRQTYVETPQAALDALERDHADVLKVLLFVAKADDRMTAAERAIVLSCCRQVVSDERITASEVERLLRAMQVPTVNAFRRAALRIHRASSTQSRMVFDAARDMIAADKRSTERERDAITYLARRWGYVNEAID